MADKELNDLLSEMEFSSPSRSLREEERIVIPSALKTEANDKRNRNKKVLISESSLTSKGNLMDVYGDETIGSSKTSYHKPESEYDFKSKSLVGTSSKISKNYKVFMVDEPSGICRRVLNQGVTFCMNENCTINHRSCDTATLAQGELYVIKATEKGRSVAFMEPSCNSEKIDPSFVEKWSDWSKSLDAWTKIFRLAMNTMEVNEKASLENMMKEKAVMDSIRTVKTPRKVNKGVILEEPLSVYTSCMEKIEDEKPKTVEERFVHIDKACMIMYAEMQKIKAKNEILNKLLSESSSNLDLRLTELQDDVGNKPSHLDFDFDAPSIWGTIGTLANTLKEVEPKGLQIESIPEAKVVKLIQDSEYSLKSDFISTLKSEVDHATMPVGLKVENVRHILIETAKKLRDQTQFNTGEIDTLNRRMDNLALGGRGLTGSTDDLEEEVDLLRDRLSTLEGNMDHNNSKGEAIKFNNIGFPSKFESDAWLELHMPEGNFGYLIDFHTLMEHIHHAITGVDSLKQLQNVYKLKLSTIAESLAVTSFEVSLPRFLSSSGAHTVIDNEMSHFTHIKSYKVWNDPSSGFKFRWKKEIERFRRAHLKTIKEKISIRSPLYNLATSSLSESIAWTTGLINYIDLTFEEYSAGKFGIPKAWHITTKLATALMWEVSKPREGALHSFTAGDGVAIGKVIFYATLRSLDVMSDIAALDYTDSPVVSTELVKFLSQNTAVESVDKLVVTSAQLTTNVRELTTDMVGAKKSINSVGNLSDELKRGMENVRKRLEKLETKK